MTFVADFEPRSLWRRFDAILAIPRGSGEEERMRAFVVGVASRNGLEHRTDATGNLVVRKPGSPGRESAPATLLQAHLDMVNEKNADVDFDFATDAIRPVLDGEYLTADGTTLGSDNGIGVAAMLSIMEARDLVHGPLEFLFTVDEETGLTGASGLDPSLLSAKRLINLDSEEEGTLTVGCAGGADTDLSLPLAASPAPAGATARTVALTGLKGGHSGVDIHLQRGNAVQLLARALRAAAPPGLIADIAGGNKHNAIPREAWATLVIPAAAAADFLRRLEVQFERVKAEFAVPEPGMAMRVTETAVPDAAWDAAASARALDLLVALPHGVVAMSHDIPGLVETSTNLAAARRVRGALEVLMSSRSSVASGLEWIRSRIDAVAALAGARANHHDGYPGWKPDLRSPLLGVVRAVHARVLGFEPRVGAIHAGLECGLIGRLVPGMDMISVGPRIEFPHSPGERVNVASVGRFYELLTGTLEELAG